MIFEITNSFMMKFMKSLRGVIIRVSYFLEKLKKYERRFLYNLLKSFKLNLCLLTGCKFCNGLCVWTLKI